MQAKGFSVLNLFSTGLLAKINLVRLSATVSFVSTNAENEFRRFFEKSGVKSSESRQRMLGHTAPITALLSNPQSDSADATSPHESSTLKRSETKVTRPSHPGRFITWLAWS